MKNEHYKFELTPLPYAYSALEPYIDALTMQLHHDRHLKTYIDNLNAALEKYPEYQSWSLEKLITNANWLPPDIRTTVINNAGGVYNHEFFFTNLAPPNTTALSEELANKINQTFGSYDKFKQAFKTAALSVFGSGYAWLVLDKNGNLKIITTANQGTPLTLDMKPIMAIDVWEHAYYLKHYNVRADYIDDWFNVVNLEKASENYASALVVSN